MIPVSDVFVRLCIPHIACSFISRHYIGLGDVSEVMEKHPDLFTEKVKAVIIVGSVQPLRRRSKIEAEITGDEEWDNFAQKVYDGCQQFNIPTITMSREVSRGFPFPSSCVDDLARTNHMTSIDVQRKEESQTNCLWEEGTKESRKYTFGNDKPQVGQCNLWGLVKSINLELVLGLLCCLPMYRDAHFRWEKHRVSGLDHLICRHQSAKAGIIKPQNLSDEILILIGFALRTALLNTSC